MTETEAFNVMAVLASAFPNNKVTEKTVDIYVDFIKPYDYELTKQACLCLIKTVQFFPTVAEITSTVERFSPDQIPAADQAWDEVGEQLRKVGHIGKPQFSHDAIKEAVRVMGWMNLCRSENVGVDRGQFMKIYESVKGRHKDNKINAQVLQLAGNIGLLGVGK